jgi:hypothetical protein
VRLTARPVVTPCAGVLASRSKRSATKRFAIGLMVPKVGIEPTLPERNEILSLARLPIPPLRLGRSAQGLTFAAGRNLHYLSRSDNMISC